MPEVEDRNGSGLRVRAECPRRSNLTSKLPVEERSSNNVRCPPGLLRPLLRKRPGQGCQFLTPAPQRALFAPIGEDGDQCRRRFTSGGRRSDRRTHARPRPEEQLRVQCRRGKRLQFVFGQRELPPRQYSIRSGSVDRGCLRRCSWPAPACFPNCQPTALRFASAHSTDS